MSEKPTIAALRAWLKSCPLIAEEQEATGAAFRIAGLDEDATAFSIEDSPGDPVLTEYFSGRTWQRTTSFCPAGSTARQTCSPCRTAAFLSSSPTG